MRCIFQGPRILGYSHTLFLSIDVLCMALLSDCEVRKGFPILFDHLMILPQHWNAFGVSSWSKSPLYPKTHQLSWPFTPFNLCNFALSRSTWTDHCLDIFGIESHTGAKSLNGVGCGFFKSISCFPPGLGLVLYLRCFSMADFFNNRPRWNLMSPQGKFNAPRWLVSSPQLDFIWAIFSPVLIPPTFVGVLEDFYYWWYLRGAETPL